MAATKPSAGRDLHWLIAFAVFTALASGYALTWPGAYSVSLLQIHVASGATAGLLSLGRVLVWLTVGAPPPVFAARSRLQAGIARIAHILLRVVPLLLLASGLGMISLAGAVSAVANGSLPDLAGFENLPPNMLHHAAAFLLALLTGLHGLAAFWHFLRRPNSGQDRGKSHQKAFSS